MIINASVRPKGLKRGVTTKKVHEAMGWGKELGLSQVCMNLELTAESRPDTGLLKTLYDYFVGDDYTVIVLDGDGKEICRGGKIPAKETK